MRLTKLTLTVRQDNPMRLEQNPVWVGWCRELGLVASGPNHWEVWADLLTICKAQIAFAVENGIEEDLTRD